MRHIHLAAALAATMLGFNGVSAQSTATVTKASAVRHYDCSKAGNASKAACKGAAKPMMPAAPAAAPAAPAASAPAASATHTVATRTTRSTTTQTSSAAGPNGATALCNDGSYSHSAHHSGSCSRHKGVKQFY